MDYLSRKHDLESPFPDFELEADDLTSGFRHGDEVLEDLSNLTISFSVPIVEDLRAETTSEAERLQKIAERVNFPQHGKSEDYFELAAPMAGFVLQIEDGTLTDVASFLGLGQRLRTIITHWSNATGKVIKCLPQQIATPAAAA